MTYILFVIFTRLNHSLIVGKYYSLSMKIIFNKDESPTQYIRG